MIDVKCSPSTVGTVHVVCLVYWCLQNDLVIKKICRVGIKGEIADALVVSHVKIRHHLAAEGYHKRITLDYSGMRTLRTLYEKRNMRCISISKKVFMIFVTP